MFSHVVQVLGPVWSSRIISLTTIFVEILADTFAFGRKIGHSTVHWLSGSSRTWVFMRENIGPFPSSAVENYQFNSNVTWHYDVADNGLTYVDPNFDRENEDGNIIIEPQQLPWLSAKIVYNGGEYEIDDFMSEFNFVAPRGVKPTPKLILNCWSIWSGIWLMPGQEVRFNTINHDGEEETFYIHSRPASEVDRWSELFDSDEEDEEGEEEGSEEEGGEEEDGEKSEAEDEDDKESKEVAEGDAEEEDSEGGDEGDEAHDSGEDADAEMSEESAEVVEKSN